MIVNKEMLNAVLDAALTTARSYRGKSNELYALGQLEATANLIYITICCQDKRDFGHLEIRCQASAQEAVDRMERIMHDKTARSGSSAQFG